MNIIDLIFPPRCILCDAVLQNNEKALCGKCYGDLPQVVEPICKRCGKPLEIMGQEYCLDCAEKRTRQDALEQGIALWIYDENVKRLMANVKYGGCKEDIHFFAKEMMQTYGKKIQDWRIDAVIPVPLHRRRRWFRGYNQAEVLAVDIGKYLNLPVLADVLCRKRPTSPQKGLLPKQRKENLLGAFALDGNKLDSLIGVKEVLLVDDIYTTGATLEACGEVLRQAGVRKIYFACLCIGRDY